MKNFEFIKKPEFWINAALNILIAIITSYFTTQFVVKNNTGVIGTATSNSGNGANIGIFGNASSPNNTGINIGVMGTAK